MDNVKRHVALFVDLEIVAGKIKIYCILLCKRKVIFICPTVKWIIAYFVLMIYHEGLHGI